MLTPGLVVRESGREEVHSFQSKLLLGLLRRALSNRPYLPASNAGAASSARPANKAAPTKQLTRTAKRRAADRAGPLMLIGFALLTLGSGMLGQNMTEHFHPPRRCRSAPPPQPTVQRGSSSSSAHQRRRVRRHA